MMRSEGNTAGGGAGDRTRPLPRADEAPRVRPAHTTRPKSTGLDFAALAPTCGRCGEKRGDVDTASGLCRRCAAPAAALPAAPETETPAGVTDPGSSVTDEPEAATEDVEDDTEPLDDEPLTDTPPGDDPAPRAATAPPRDDEVSRMLDVLVDELHPDPDNPREDVGDVTELAASMRTVGLLQPIVARRVVEPGRAPRLVVVAGHRRLAAVKSLGWTRVTVIVRRDMPADEVLAAMLIENGQRAGLDPIEEARALRRLAHDRGAASHQQIAALIGRTQVHVSGRLALLELSVEDQEAVRAGELSVVAATRRGRIAAGRVRDPGSTGTPHLGADHDLARRVKARCQQLKHKRGGRNSVGGVGCGACWESVIRADERTHLHDVSNQRGRCVLCDTDQETRPTT